jgi:hypothetical protein
MPKPRGEGANEAALDVGEGGVPPHSVLTLHLKESGPTKAAEQRVIRFFKERMGAS